MLVTHMLVTHHTCRGVIKTPEDAEAESELLLKVVTHLIRKDQVGVTHSRRTSRVGGGCPTMSSTHSDSKAGYAGSAHAPGSSHCWRQYVHVSSKQSHKAEQE
jgi:hypothetical protein